MRPFGQVLADYVQISKPRIILLLLIVAWASMFMAAEGVPGWVTFAAVTAAGTFSTASSGAFNNVIERAKDAKMGRTANRPVASGRISPLAATTYAAVMAAAAFASLWFTNHALAAWLTLGAIVFYVVIYTVALKPTTPQNIVIGGFAGSFPALIGWGAVTDSLAIPAAWPAWLLASIVFFWTPPHFWALALLYKEDYEAADYPMMPTIRGEESTKKQMIFYAVLTAVASVGIVAVGAAGYLFLIAALWLGFRLVQGAAKLLGETPRPQFRTYFLFTIQYLGILLIALMLDQMLIHWVPATAPF